MNSALYNHGSDRWSTRANAAEALCGYSLPVLTDIGPVAAASKHITTPINHTRPSVVVVVLLQPPHHNRFTALFPGPPGWAGARRELLDFMVQGKINRGKHTDHPAGRHSIQTNQCPPPPVVLVVHYESKKGCHPIHGYNFVNSSSICKILSLLQRAVNFQQNSY